MKNTKKILSVFLALLMLYSSAPLSTNIGDLFTLEAFAAEIVDSGSYGSLQWTYDDGGTLTISGEGKMVAQQYFEIPWFTKRAEIKTVMIEEGVQNIGNFAFQNCTELTSVTVPTSVTSIGKSAFEGCSSFGTIYYAGTKAQWNEIEISSELNETLINAAITYDTPSGKCGDNLMWYMNLKNYTLTISGEGDMYSVYEYENEYSPWYAYKDSIKYVVMDNTVTSIGSDAFKDCSQLVSIKLSESLDYIATFAFAYCTSLSHIILPDSVTSISVRAFYECTSLSHIKIPEGLDKISGLTFAHSGLKSVEIPASVKTIEQSAFTNCPNISKVYYSGTESEWNNITVGNYNDTLLNAEIIFGVCDHTGGEATCVKQANCEKCGNYYGDVDSDKHGVHEIRNGFSPTCISDGYTGDYWCTECGAKLFDGEVISAHESWHNFEWIIEENPTCTTEGYKYQECTHCKTKTAGESIPVVHSGGEATCIAPASCELCGTAYGELSPDVHKGEVEYRNSLPATCAEAGYEGDIYCIDCGEFIKKGKTLSETKEHNYISGSCTVCGGFVGIAYFDNTLTQWDEVYSYYWSNGYIPLAWPGFSTTQTEDENLYCIIQNEDVFTPYGGYLSKVCENIIFNNNNGAQTADLVFVPCGIYTLDGFTGNYKHTYTNGKCMYCTAECSHENTQTRNAVTATCVTDGYTGDTYCIDCDALIETGESTLATGEHSYTYTLETYQYTGEIITETCTNEGCSHRAESYIVPQFGAKYTGKPIVNGLVLFGSSGTFAGGLRPTLADVVYSQNGEVVDEVIYPGTYTASITIGDKTASVETTVYRASITAQNAENLFVFTPPSDLNVCDGLPKEVSVTLTDGVTGVGSITVKYFEGETELEGAPTAPGTYTVKIDVADGSNYYSANNLTADSWTFTFEITEDTEHTYGTKYLYDDNSHWKKCVNCDVTDEKLPHTPEEDDGDCTTAIRCSVCDTITTEGRASHTGGEATCTAAAVCDVCEQSYDGTNPDNHKNKTTVTGTPATCGKEGLTDGEKCNDCGETITAQEPIPATGDHKNTEIRNKADATYEADGYTGDTYCADCGALLEMGTAIPKLENPDEPNDNNCDHICHSDSKFVQFFWKIIRFFQKLFKIEQYCDCGAQHW